MDTVRDLNVSHHLANDDDFWPELLVNGKDVNEAKCEDHVVHAEDVPAKFVRPLEHPAYEDDNQTNINIPVIEKNYCGNSTTVWTDCGPSRI